jgi:hypothetical protein
LSPISAGCAAVLCAGAEPVLVARPVLVEGVYGWS